MDARFKPGLYAQRLVMIVIEGGDYAAFLEAIPASQRQFVKDLARPPMTVFRFYAVRVANDPAYLAKVPEKLRPRVMQYADTLRRQRNENKE